MSASREKNRRNAQVEHAVPAKQKKKISEGWILAISVVLIVALVFGGVLGYRIYQSNRTVLTVGDHEIKASEFTYFYYNAVSTMSEYASYLGIDTAVALDEQKVTSDGVMYMGLFGLDSSYLSDYKANEEGVYEDVNWAQVFASTAKTNAIQAYTLYQAAVSAGFEVEALDSEHVNEEIDSVSISAAVNGMELDDFLREVYGRGCDEESYRSFLSVNHTASHYAESLSYSEEERAARYEESPETFDAVTYYAYNVSASDFVEAAEDGTTPEATDAEKAEAKAAAEKMAAEFDIESADVSLYADHTESMATAYAGADGAKWLLTEAKPGDVKLFEGESTYYVVKLLAKGDYKTVNALEIFIANDGEDEEIAEGELSAQERVDAVIAAMEADPTEENFRALMTEYSEQESGDVENMTRSTMNNVASELLTWAGLDEERTAGQYASFSTSEGTIILYFTGYGMDYLDLVVDSTISSEWLDEAVKAATEICGYSEDAAMGAKVGYYA